jgi:hypothetical protein
LICLVVNLYCFFVVQLFHVFSIYFFVDVRIIAINQTLSIAKLTITQQFLEILAKWLGVLDFIAINQYNSLKWQEK